VETAMTVTTRDVVLRADNTTFVIAGTTLTPAPTAQRVRLVTQGRRVVAAVVVLLVALMISGCGGDNKYAGLSRDEARQAALDAITGRRNVDPQPIDERKDTNNLGGDAWVVEFNSTDHGERDWCVWVWQRPGDAIGSYFIGC
jgi:hypothetical protein